jgi:hypothetical protein
MVPRNLRTFWNILIRLVTVTCIIPGRMDGWMDCVLLLLKLNMHTYPYIFPIFLNSYSNARHFFKSRLYKLSLLELSSIKNWKLYGLAVA